MFSGATFFNAWQLQYARLSAVKGGAVLRKSVLQSSETIASTIPSTCCLPVLQWQWHTLPVCNILRNSMQWHTLKKKIAIPWNSLFCERSSNLYKTYNKRSQSLYTLYADSENCKRRIGVTLADDASEGFDSWVHQAVRNGLCKRPDSQKELSIPPFSFSWHFCWRNNSDVWSTSSSFQFALIFGFLNALCW